MEHISFFDPTWGQTPDDLLECGTRRGKHDHHGNCDECPVCKEGFCRASENGLEEHDGEWFHSACLLADRKRKAIVALDAFLAAMKELQRIDEECLILSDATTMAYDSWDLLATWRHRNKTLLDGAAK